MTGQDISINEKGVVFCMLLKMLKKEIADILDVQISVQSFFVEL